jgi:hypothetical protein
VTSSHSSYIATCHTSFAAAGPQSLSAVFLPAASVDLEGSTSPIEILTVAQAPVPTPVQTPTPTQTATPTPARSSEGLGSAPVRDRGPSAEVCNPVGVSPMTSAAYPAGPSEPPLVQTAWWLARPIAFMESCRRRYGDAFSVRFTGFQTPTVMLSDP